MNSNYNIYTTTVIINTNVEINLEWLFKTFSVYDITTPCIIKKNKDLENLLRNLNAPRGSIVRIEYKDGLKGFKIKKGKRSFRNTLSMVLFIDKLINMKIPIKGKLQLTGCVNEQQAKECVRILYDTVLKYPQNNDTYYINTIQDESDIMIKCVFKIVMTNIIFHLGFNINRQALDEYMNSCTEYNSSLETSAGYTGVKIKKSFDIDNEGDVVTCLELNTFNEWTEHTKPYKMYKSMLEKAKEKPKKNTFLVFHSGRAIMSGMKLKYMDNIYKEFNQIITEARDYIEEKIDD